MQARERLQRFEYLAGAVVASGWALGGIGLLYGGLVTLVPPSLGRGVALLVATGLVGTIVSLPFDIYRTFRDRAAVSASIGPRRRNSFAIWPSAR